MATKSFQTDFKMSKKSSVSLFNALSNSRKSTYEPKQPIKNVRDKDAINKLMSSFQGK